MTTYLSDRKAQTIVRERRLKYLCVINPSKRELNGVSRGLEVSFLPMEKVSEHGTLRLDETRSIEDMLQGFTYFRDGDIIVAKITPCFENGKGALCRGLVNGIGFGSTEFHVLRPRAGVDGRFLNYVTRTAEFRGLGAALMYGAAGQQRVPESFIENYVVFVPPLYEQRAIADFLDRKTAQIDALIARKQRQIELLGEKRQALNSQAVTKGLDPTAPMKGSGFPWLGEVPEHWEVTRIKWVARMESGHTPDKKVEAYWTNCNIPWVSLNDSKQLRVIDYISETAHYVNELGIANSSARLLPPGAVVFSRDATIGLCAITTTEMAVSQHFIAWLCGPQVRPEYLLRVFECMTEELERLTFGATVKTIGMPDVRELVMPLPPLSEQDAILQAVRGYKSSWSELSRRVERQVELLREYRQTLISAAVTGKLQVPMEVAR